jgi:hypothetical protein
MAKKLKNNKINYKNSLFLQVEQIDKFIFFVIAFMVLLIPIFVFYHDATNVVVPKFVYSDTTFDYKDDIFSYNKFVLLMISTLILIILFLVKIFLLKSPIIETKLNWSFVLLFFLIPLSALLSPFKSVATWGMYNRCEGAITVFSLIFLVLLIINTHFKETQIQKLIFFTAPFLLLNTVLGLLYFYGVNILNFLFIRNLIGIPDYIDSGNSAFSSTLQNPNYLSGVSGFLFILFFTLMVFHKKMSIKSFAFLLAFLAFVNVLLSISTSGFLTIVVLIPIILTISGFSKIDSWKHNLLFLIALLLICTSSLVLLSKHNQLVWNESVQAVLNLKYQFVDDSNKVEFISDPLSKSTDSNKVESISDPLNKNYEDFLPVLLEAGQSGGSGRIYIWKMVIESWKQSPLLGYGLDTTEYYLNQDDIQKVSGLGSYYTLIDKPHNYYLGILAGAGILTFIPLVFLFGYLVVRFVQSILNKSENVYIIVFGFSSFAFFIQAFFNDLVIETDVIYWVFIGLLANQLLRAKRNA